jgi:hypothetical protein
MRTVRGRPADPAANPTGAGTPPSMDDTVGGPGSGRRPSMFMRLLGLTTFVGLGGFAVTELVQVIQHGTVGLVAASLSNALVWLAGVNSIIIGSGHLTMPDPIARSIGWPVGNPFQWEVGLAGILIGVLGVLSTSFDRDFQLAAVLSFSIFYLGAAVGHIREMLTEHNFASGNAGFIFYYDVVTPLITIALFIAT